MRNEKECVCSAPNWSGFWISEKNSNYFPIQRYVSELSFLTETKGVYCAVRAESLTITEVTENKFVFTARYVLNLLDRPDVKRNNFVFTARYVPNF